MVSAPTGNRLQRTIFSAGVSTIAAALIYRDRILRKLTPIQPSHTVSRHIISSGPNQLDAVLVNPTCQPIAAILICHGIGETVEHWPRAQHLLAAHGIASLLFNYSGCGRSTGRFSAHQSEQDAIAAFHWLPLALPRVPISLLGFSLGSGVATAIASHVPATQLILCEAYTSFRNAACSLGLPRFLASLIPDTWPTQRTLATLTLPILIVHGEQDRLFPTQMARDLASACTCKNELILIPNMGHSDLHSNPTEAHWQPIIRRLSLSATQTR